MKKADVQLTAKPRRLSKAAVVLGGFLIMTGIVFVGFALFHSTFSVIVSQKPEYGTLFIWVLLVISVCDIIAGVILLLR